MLTRVHATAGVLGAIVIGCFWTSTVGVELFGTTAAVEFVKTTIPWGLLVLVPALAATGATGARMAAGATDPRILRKRRRMMVIAATGLLVLVPAALYLAVAVTRPPLGGAFYTVQTIELFAGALNLTLIALNIRDGLRLTGRLGPPRSAHPPKPVRPNP